MKPCCPDHEDIFDRLDADPEAVTDEELHPWNTCEACHAAYLTFHGMTEEEWDLQGFRLHVSVCQALGHYGEWVDA